MKTNVLFAAYVTSTALASDCQGNKPRISHVEEQHKIRKALQKANHCILHNFHVCSRNTLWRRNSAGNSEHP